MGVLEKETNGRRRISITQNPHYPRLAVKCGENQYSRHSHVHQTWSLGYVLQGRTLVSLGTWESELTEDQFIAVPSGIPHLCSPETGNPFSFIVLYIPTEYLDIRTPEFSQPRIGGIDSKVLFDLIDLFMQATNKSELDNNSENLQKFLNKNSSPLDEEWGENLSEKEILFTQESPYGSRFQLYRYTRKLFGLGQKKISTIGKMEHAKILMSEGLNLAEIAVECGFYDQSHFSKVFKLYTGLTPTQYMKK